MEGLRYRQQQTGNQSTHVFRAGLVYQAERGVHVWKSPVPYGIAGCSQRGHRGGNQLRLIVTKMSASVVARLFNLDRDMRDSGSQKNPSNKQDSNHRNLRKQPQWRRQWKLTCWLDYSISIGIWMTWVLTNPSKMAWRVNIYPSPNFNGWTVEVWAMSSHALLGMWLLIDTGIKVSKCIHISGLRQPDKNVPDTKVHRAHMGSTWGRQDPGGPHVEYVNFAIWVTLTQWTTAVHNAVSGSWETFIMSHLCAENPWFINTLKF